MGSVVLKIRGERILIGWGSVFDNDGILAVYRLDLNTVDTGHAHNAFRNLSNSLGGGSSQSKIGYAGLYITPSNLSGLFGIPSFEVNADDQGFGGDVPLGLIFECFHLKAHYF